MLIATNSRTKWSIFWRINNRTTRGSFWPHFHFQSVVISQTFIFEP